MPLMHWMAEVVINSAGDLIEFPVCESERDYNSGRWTDNIDDVTCTECLTIFDARTN